MPIASAYNVYMDVTRLQSSFCAIPRRVPPDREFVERYHEQITRDALSDFVRNPQAMDAIVTADLGQDDGDADGDPVNHGDDNRMEETINRSRAWLSDARDRLNGATDDAAPVLADIGCVCHALQDLVSHSTYVETVTASGAYATPDEVPIPAFILAGRPPGVVTGSYDPAHPDASGTPQQPTHADINKDEPDTRRGAEPVPGMAQAHCFDVAESVATRETRYAVEALLSGLTPQGRATWERICGP